MKHLERFKKMIHFGFNMEILVYKTNKIVHTICSFEIIY
jgi:hypothetical protein